MKTVVTGGNGFIGSHLMKRLLDEGREVIAASSFSSGEENLKELGVEVEYRNVDLRDYRQAQAAVAGAESVFHLAARVGSIDYLHHSQTAEFMALQTNLLIDANVFRACCEAGVTRLVYASSCAVYPMEKQFSFGTVLTEDSLDLLSNPSEHHNPDGGYGWAKLIGELQLNWTKDMAIGIARIFNIYGVNEPIDEKAHAIGSLIRRAILYSGGEFKAWGSGQQTRDYLYISDCAEALVKLEWKASSPPTTVNIGSGKATSIREIVEKIIAISGKEIEPVFDLSRPVGPLSRTADIGRAKAFLDWQPKVSLDESLRHTYLWAEKRLAKHEDIGRHSH